jgi:hypothetical protein
VFAQTYGDFEVIVVNDGGRDDTESVLRPYIEAQRIRYLWQENQGVAAARNAGLAMATGDWIVFLDDDDLWLTDKLEWQVACLEASNAVVVGGSCSRFGRAEERKERGDSHKIEFLRTADLFRGNPFGSPGQTLIRKSALEQIGGLDTAIWGWMIWICGFACHRSAPFSDWLAKHSLRQVSHESIYQHIYRDKQAGGTLHSHFPPRCKSYRKRGSGNERRGRLKDQVMIDQRPSVVDERSRLGDWEMDTVIGRPGGSVLVTMVERVSRYTLIALAASKEAIAVGGAILRAMHPHREKVLTMTYDNGKELLITSCLPTCSMPTPISLISIIHGNEASTRTPTA